jgi:CheY-like chemotaxis protein
MQKFILIVDDDSDDAQFLSEAVHQTNKTYTCIAVSNGDEALDFLYTTKRLPDFIFLDLNMPKINGKECLIKIKANHQFDNIPVIIYSTTSQKQEKDELYRLGANYFLTKPYDFAILRNSISKILSDKGTAVITG